MSRDFEIENKTRAIAIINRLFIIKLHEKRNETNPQNIEQLEQRTKKLNYELSMAQNGDKDTIQRAIAEYPREIRAHFKI